MIKLSSARRMLSTAQGDSLKLALNELPWNFYAHLMDKEIESLEAPVDLG